jgi:hypothetical protein
VEPRSPRWSGDPPLPAAWRLSLYSRRTFLHRATAAALASAGVYETLDSLAGAAGAAPPPPPGPPPPPPPRPPGPRPAPPGPPQATGGEQYLFTGRTVVDNGVTVISPPLHHAVVTAQLTGRVTVAAQASLESVLAGLERSGLLDFTAGGGGVTIAWGKPYFNRLPAALVAQYMPVDRIASAAAGRTVPALLDAFAFASDPASLVLESNDLAVVVASDSIDHVNAITSAIFNGAAASLFRVTSIRRGFVDASQLGTRAQSLTKQLAVAAGVAGASSIPDQAELFLGFTSTQRDALAPSNVPSLETLPGITDQWPNGYFARGTTMHLSHIKEDLVAWYARSYPTRVGAAFSAAHPVDPAQPVTVPVRPEQEGNVRAELRGSGYVGHSSSMQPVSRLDRRVVDNYGVPWRPGTPIPLRADFNTLDNPFSFSSTPGADGFSATPAAGVHFLAYMPTSDMFHRMRRAMDGQYADGALGAAAVHGPFNRVLETTHRQNFLVPPRAHRSFPLAELL